MSVADNVWRDLLAASVEMQTASGSGSGSTDAHQPPSKENIEYLQNAMAATFGTVPTEKSAIEEFLELGRKEDLSEQEVDKAIDVSEKLSDFLCSRNFPSVFTQKEGLDCLFQLTIKSPDEELRFSYLSLIPLLAENNLDFQNVVIDHPLFDSLLNASLDDKSSRIVSSALSSISAIVRSCPKAWHKFHDMQGLQRFEKIIKNFEKEKVAAKAAIILTNIKFTLVECADEKEIKSSQVDQKYMDLCDVIIRSYIYLRNRKSSDEFVTDCLSTIQKKLLDLPVELCTRISNDVKLELDQFLMKSDPKNKDKFHLAMKKKFQSPK